MSRRRCSPPPLRTSQQTFLQWRAGKHAVKMQAQAEKEEERRRKGLLTGEWQLVGKGWWLACWTCKRSSYSFASEMEHKLPCAVPLDPSSWQPSAPAMCTGREIFQEEGFVAADDLAAADDSGYLREVDEEAEFARASAAARERAAVAAAAASAGVGRAEEAGQGTTAAAGEKQGAIAPAAPQVQLSKAEEAELFDDDDDDDEGGMLDELQTGLETVRLG